MAGPEDAPGTNERTFAAGIESVCWIGAPGVDRSLTSLRMIAVHEHSKVKLRKKINRHKWEAEPASSPELFVTEVRTPSNLPESAVTVIMDP